MIQLKYNPADRRYLFVLSDNASEVSLLQKHLNKIPRYMFLPSFNKSLVKPVVFLNTTKTKDGRTVRWVHSGLWKEVVDFCKKNGIECNTPDEGLRYSDYRCSFDDFKKQIEGWKLNLQPREYQLRAAWLIVQYRQSLSQLATRAGKTLIAYMVFRYMIEHGAHNILMIVPNITLVRQGVDDMKDYKEFFSTEAIWSKGEYCSTANLTIGTFQSLVKRIDPKSAKYDPKFYNKFDVVCVDEAHTAKCKTINDILSQPFIRACKLRFGFSGTLPDSDTIESFEVQSLMGPMIQNIESRELMDAGYITPVQIRQVHIKHDLDDALLKEYIRYGEYLCGNYVYTDGKKSKKMLPKEEQSFTMKYQKTLPTAVAGVRRRMETGDETPEGYMDFLCELCKAQGSNMLMLEQMLAQHDQHRLEVIADILSGIDKNTIVFAHHTEYLNHLEAYFKEKFPQRNVYKITGSTVPKKRSEIIAKMLTDKDAILVASYGCVGTGLTLKNLDYGIFAQSFRSKIINLQSLGRGLGLSPDKAVFTLYDIIDEYPTGCLSSQGRAKVKMYKEKKLPYTVEYR